MASSTIENSEKINSTAGLTTKVMKGGLWSLLGQVLPLVASLFTVPLIIRMLGADGYGVIVLVGLIPSYLSFADFGMGMASTKFGSEAFGKGDSEREARIVRTSAVIAFVVSLPFGSALFIFSATLIGFLNVPDQLQGEASLALKFAAITFIVNFLNNIFNTPQLARIRMDLNTFVTSGFRVLGTIAVPIIIYLGGGVSGALFGLMVASFLTLAGHLAVSRRLNSKLFGIALEKEVVRPLLKYGGALALSGIAAVLLVNLEKLVLTKVSTVQDLGYYAVAFTFANMATLFSLAMGQSLLPAFSQLLAPENREQLNNLFARALKISIFALLPILVALCVVAKPFFTLWAGEDFGRESTWPFYVLLIGLFFNLNAYNPAGLLLAAGKTNVIAKLYWIELVPYIAVTVLLTSRFGAVGAAAAWSLRVLVDALIYVWLARLLVGVRLDLSRHMWSLALGIMILSPPVISTLLLETSLIWLAMLLVICSGVYCLLIWNVIIDRDEKVWIKRQSGVFLRMFGRR